MEQAVIEAKRFDLADLDVVANANRGATFELVHPGTFRKLGMKLTMVGTDSDTFRNFKREQSNRKVREGFLDFDLAEAEELSIEMLAKCTIGWEGFMLDGAELPFTHENVVMVYKRFPWIKEQADRFMGSRANFIKG